MKKYVKRSLWAVGSLIVVLLLAAGGLGLKMYLELRKMTPVETGKIHDSVYTCKDKFVNSFLFKGEHGYVMVDAGLGAESMAAEMQKLGINPDEVVALLLTHTDSDHTGGVGLFRNATVYMHKDEVQMIDGRTGKIPFYKAIWKYGPYKTFGSNDTLHIDGLEVKVIFAPGHTPGSCCFLVNGTDLAVGDNLSLHNGVISTFNDFANMDSKQQAEALAKIPELHTAKYILSAHYGVLQNK